MGSHSHTALRMPARVGALGALVGAVMCCLLAGPAGATASPQLSAHAMAAAQPLAPVLRLGSRGAAVRTLQRSLSRLSYLPPGADDGIFGMQTWHAVVAFQGWSGIARDGIVGSRTRATLARAHRPVPWSQATGVEIHIAQQVLLLVRNGYVWRAIHVSTGSNGRTPLGHFRIYRRQTLSWSVPFHVWMPLAQYFHGGYAMHEFASVPAYPASHGCVRIPRGEAAVVWRFGTIGMRVWTRR